MRHGNLDVHLHGVGGRTVPQVYHLDLQLVERISPDVILLQLGGNDINDTTSATDVLVQLEQLITVLREKRPDSTIIVASIICRRRPRGLSSRSYDRKKKRVNKFLLKEFGLSSRGRKSFSLPTNSLGRNTLTGMEFTSMMMETGVSITAFLQPFGWSCDAQLAPSCSDWYRQVSCQLTFAVDPTIHSKRPFSRPPNDQKRCLYYNADTCHM